jgi:hypothetical protein
MLLRKLKDRPQPQEHEKNWEPLEAPALYAVRRLRVENFREL